MYTISKMKNTLNKIDDRLGIALKKIKKFEEIIRETMQKLCKNYKQPKKQKRIKGRQRV